MKRSVLTVLILIFISFSLHSQESRRKNAGRVGISYSSFGIIQDEREENARYYGSPAGSGNYYYDHYIEKMFYTIGFNYLKPLNSWLEFETGLEYSRKVGSAKTLYPYGDYIVNKANSTFVSFPFTMRANFFRFFFINGGVLLDLDLGGYTPERYQSGIGYLFGIAAKYDFKFGTSIFINPYIKKRSLVSIWPNEDRMKVDELGIRVGVNFNLKKNNTQNNSKLTGL